MKVLLCFGTRPEAIKMAPVFHELKKSDLDVKICVTAQHRQMLDQVLDFFEMVPDYDLNLMEAGQTLNSLCSKIFSAVDSVFVEEMPDLVLVHGDTTTSSIVALAAFHRKIQVGHVEAGLRTYNKQSPFPEEMNRQLTAKIADFHFAPSHQAVDNLINEHIDKRSIFNVGNSVIDALLWGINKIHNGYENQFIKKLESQIDLSKKIVLVTGHRRENFGQGLENICNALLELAERDDVLIIYPVHLNPNVSEPVHQILSGNKNIMLIPPAEYPLFIWLMKSAFLIISDSGGVQEEAPTFGKPVLVTREFTERSEGIKGGFSFLVGVDKQRIVDKVNYLLDNFTGFEQNENPYGDGKTSQKIVDIIKRNMES